MLRNWIRHWLGVEEDSRQNAQVHRTIDKSLSCVEDMVLEHSKEIQGLKVLRERRELKAQSVPVTDWETIQAMWAANPENYKENA